MVVFKGSLDSNIQRTRGVNTLNNIHSVKVIEVSHEVFNVTFKLMRSGNVYIQCPHSTKRADLAIGARENFFWAGGWGWGEGGAELRLPEKFCFIKIYS